MTAAALTPAERNRRFAAVFRALSGDPGVDLWAGRPVDGTGPLPMNAPHLYPPDTAENGSLRGASDAMALRRRWSDLEAHRRGLPESDAERLIVEILEQYRCESLAHHPGVRRNLRNRHADWCGEYLTSRLHETHLGLLLFTVVLTARTVLTGDPMAPAHADLIESTRFALAGDLGSHYRQLRRLRGDQTAFAEAARSLAAVVAGHIDTLTAAHADSAGARARGGPPVVPLVLDVTDDFVDAARGSSGGAAGAGEGYRIWDDRHDLTSTIADLVRREQRLTLRRELTAAVAEEAVALAPVITGLRAAVACDRDAWVREEAGDGVLDRSRLARLVTAPGDPRVFRGLTTTSATDCAVTFLIDCSGSMKDHAPATAALLDVLGTALDRLDVSTEILGFTTSAWTGGRPMQKWKRAGRPDGPGRLNEVHHIIVTSSGTPWRRARIDLAGLLKTSLYREGIDGEALRWAHARIREQQAAKSAIVLISDGAPADSATAEANGELYLARDLARTVTGLRGGDVGLVGVGIGCDLSPFFPTSVELDPTEIAGRTSVRAVVEALRTELRALPVRA